MRALYVRAKGKCGIKDKISSDLLTRLLKVNGYVGHRLIAIERMDLKERIIY